jgi:exonuclease V gamma subunit
VASVTTPDDLQIEIAHARTVQQAAHRDREHSPNTATIEAARVADRELDVLLDRLLLRGAK